MSFADLQNASFHDPEGPTLDEIKARLDCRTIAQEHGVNLKRATGDDWQAHCIHPERHNNGDADASLSIGERGWRCFGCDAKGDVFDLWQTLYGVTLREAIAELAELAGFNAKTATRRPPARRKRRRKARADLSPALTPKRAQEGAEGVSGWQERVKIWGKIWSIASKGGLTPEAVHYLEERGLDPGVALAAGVRDLSTVAEELTGYLRSLSPEQWKVARLLGSKGNKAWYPLEALKGDRRRQGLAFPSWYPGVDHPIGVRWRFFSRPWDGGPKAMAMAGSGWQIIANPLEVKQVANWSKTFQELKRETEERRRKAPEWREELDELWRYFRGRWEAGEGPGPEPFPTFEAYVRWRFEEPGHITELLWWDAHFAPDGEEEPWPRTEPGTPPGITTRLLAALKPEEAGPRLPIWPITILLLEGETDWLAARCAVEELAADGRIEGQLVLPIGFGIIAGGWPEELTPIIAGADRVICMFDVGNGAAGGPPKGVQLAGEVSKALVNAIGRERARGVYLRRLFHDDDDVADHHRRGELADIILELIKRDLR